MALGSVIILLILGFLAFLLGPVLFASIAYPLPEKYRGSVAKWSAEYCGGIDQPQHLLSALIMVESGWRESAHSGAGAIGMTQFIPSTAVGVAKRLGVSPFTPSDLTRNPDMSIRFGAYYICTRIKDYGGNIKKGLIAYNGGGGAVIAFESGSPVRGTVGYAEKVMTIQKAYGNIYGEWWKSPLPDPATASSVASPEPVVITPQTKFEVETKSDISVISNVPILDFWRGLLSNQVTPSADQSTDTGGGLTNLWKVFLPSGSN